VGENLLLLASRARSEELEHLEEAVKLAEELVAQAPAELCRILEHSASKPAPIAT